MELKQKILELKDKGISIRCLSELSEVSINTLYNITRDRLKNIPVDVERRLNEAISKAEKVFDND